MIDFSHKTVPNTYSVTPHDLVSLAEPETFPPSQQRETNEERRSARALNKGHGRVELRELTRTAMLNDHLDWPGVKQVCRLECTTVRNGETTHAVAYAITSVSRARADAADLLECWRSHWGIEN